MRECVWRGEESEGRARDRACLASSEAEGDGGERSGEPRSASRTIAARHACAQLPVRPCEQAIARRRTPAARRCAFRAPTHAPGRPASPPARSRRAATQGCPPGPAGRRRSIFGAGRPAGRCAAMPSHRRILRRRLSAPASTLTRWIRSAAREIPGCARTAAAAAAILQFINTFCENGVYVSCILGWKGTWRIHSVSLELGAVEIIYTARIQFSFIRTKIINLILLSYYIFIKLLLGSLIAVS